MKNLLLILLLIGIGGWYYYDKYEKPKRSEKTEQSEPADVRIAAVEKRAAELYPTDAQGRDSWKARQINALGAIDKKAENLSPEVFAEISKSASEKYGADYEKQLDYITKQRLAAIDIKNITAASAISETELKRLDDSFKKEFGSDYVTRREAYGRIMEFYAAIKQKAANLSPADYEKLSAKVLPVLFKNPIEALRLFEEQALARHNFLTKQYPSAYGDLRKDIEDIYPDDFAMQLKELDARLDAANSKGKPMVWNAGGKNPTTPLSKEYFSKYIYNYDSGTAVYVSFLLEIRGKKAVVFPSEALEGIGDTFTLNLGGGEKLSANKIYASKSSSFSIVIPSDAEKISALPVMSAAEFSGKKEMDVEILGLDLRGASLTIPAKLKEGKFLEFTDFNEDVLQKKLRSGAVIVESESKKAVALYEEIPLADKKIYDTFSDPSVKNVLAENMNRKKWKGLSGVIPFASENMLKAERRAFRIVPFESLQNVSRFDAKKYAEQTENLGRLCRSNLSSLIFMSAGSFAEDSQTPLLNGVASKYNKIFVMGSRVNVGILYSNFAAYARDIKMALLQNINFARGNFYEDYYYPLNLCAKNQFELFKRLDGVLADGLKSSDKSGILHADISKSIEGNTYVPPGRDFTPSGFARGGGSGSVLRMSNKGKNSK